MRKWAKLLRIKTTWGDYADIERVGRRDERESGQNY